MGWPVTLAVAGGGSRGTTFAGYAARFPDRARVVAVADPRTASRDTLAERHGIGAPRRFTDWRELADRPRLADAVVIATPDRQHADAACSLAGLGYHVLLEKPIAPSKEDCDRVVAAAEATGVVFAVCHVMRYTAYSDAVRAVIQKGQLGELIGIDHVEPVGWWHFAHSYVRGNWRRADQSGPAILTKCCHDMDWLRYLAGRPARRVSSVGGLRHFTAESKPAGAGSRCTDCGVEPDCPYSAVRLYVGFLADPDRRGWPLSVVTADLTEEGVRLALREGPYGRCVYDSDNDVADHQVATIEFEGGLTATLTMSAFTPMARRLTRIMGTRGFLDGDGTRITVTDFVTGRTSEAVPAADAQAGDAGGVGHAGDSGASGGAGGGASGGHSGGDYGVMGAFVHAVATGDRSRIRSAPRESLEGHLMAFAAEESRTAGGRPVPVSTLR